MGRTSSSPLFCNRNRSVVTFQPLKETLLRTTFLTKQKMANPLWTLSLPSRPPWRKLLSNFVERRWNPLLLNSITESLRNSFSQAPPALRQCDNTAMSLLRLALKSFRRLLLKWSAPLLTAQAVPLMMRF